MVTALTSDKPANTLKPPKSEFKVTVRPPDDLRLDFIYSVGVPLTSTSMVPMISGQSVQVTRTGFGISTLWRRKGGESAAGFRIGLTYSRFSVDGTKVKDFSAFGDVVDRMQDEYEERSEALIGYSSAKRVVDKGLNGTIEEIEDMGEEDISAPLTLSYMTLPIGFVWYHEGVEFLKMGRPGSTFSLNLFETNVGMHGLFAWGETKEVFETKKFKGFGVGGSLALGISAKWSDYTLGIDAALNLEYLAGDERTLVFTIDGGLFSYLQINLN